MRILVVHGPNLNLLGTREPDVYGTTTLAEIDSRIQHEAGLLGVEVECFQSNSEGEIVERVQRAPGRFDGIVMNPAAYTHTSIAIRDAVAAVGVPCVEVHISNTAGREGFRRRSYIAPVCVGVVSGFGADSYLLALRGLVAHLRSLASE